MFHLRDFCIYLCSSHWFEVCWVLLEKGDVTSEDLAIFEINCCRFLIKPSERRSVFDCKDYYKIMRSIPVCIQVQEDGTPHKLFIHALLFLIFKLINKQYLGNVYLLQFGVMLQKNVRSETNFSVDLIQYLDQISSF